MYLQALIIPFLFVVPSTILGQPHATQLGSDWNRAAEHVEKHRDAWGEVFRSLHVDAAVCEAIIFPEQLRFSRLQNRLEQAALHGLYVVGGKERADFSIGRFQMKPSFVEQVEQAWMQHSMRHQYRLYFDTSDSREQRKRRLERMSDERWQCVYLSLFVKLVEERIPELTTMPDAERVCLLATAYNTNFTASLADLQATKQRMTFHLDLFPNKSTTYYIYAAIAVKWYEETQKHSGAEAFF